jgi:putative CocE/NonD family hydrolase
MRSGPESEFWRIKGMSVVDHVPEYADVPVLHVTGWYDSWTRQVAMNYEALSAAKKSAQRLTIGPWTHGGQTSKSAGEVEFTADAAIDLLAYRLRWYDRWLKGVQNGVDDERPVWVYVMGTGDDHRTPAGKLSHGGFWRGEKEWPLARARSVPYFLHADGSLAERPPSEPRSETTFTFDPRQPVPTIGGNISSNQFLMTNGAYDQRPRDDTHAATNRLPLSERRDVLVFRSEPLSEAVEVTGTVEVRLWIKSTAPDTDFTAKLIDEIPANADYPLGFDLNLGDSIIRTRYRESLDRPKLMTPGEVYPVTITLYPTSNVFKKGHRIRVDVSSSNYPRFDLNPNTGDPPGEYRRMVAADNTVLHDAGHPSQVVLPVVAAAE